VGEFLTRVPINVGELAQAVEARSNGGSALFVGTVRDNQDGRKVNYLEYEAHEEMAEHEIGRLVESAQQRWELGPVTVRHRLGRLEIGDVSVAIAVGAPHRAPALEACRWIIDTLKAEVPIFKKEYFEDGEAWVDESAYPGGAPS
jgi:molybdopterin synthase catalytic subunit